MAIWLARHGETTLNAARVVQLPDTPLNPRGVEQARRLARRLAGLPIGLILCSDQARAKMTADEIRAEVGAPLRIDPLLQERCFGDVRGTPYSELEYDLFAPDYAPPGGETWEDFHRRVDRAWESVALHAARTDGDLVVVSHGLVCRSLAERRLETGGAVSSWPNACLTRIEGGPPWIAGPVACTAHLEDSPDDAPPEPRDGP